MKLRREELLEELEAYRRGECDEEMRRAVEAALAEFPDVAARAGVDEEIDSLHARAFALRAAPGFASRARAALDAEIGAVPAANARPIGRWLALAAAASLLVAAGLWWRLRDDSASADFDREVIANLEMLEHLDLARQDDASVLDLADPAATTPLGAVLNAADDEEL